MANPNNVTINPSFVNITPYEIYLQQVRGVTENLRQTTAGYTYLPPQFGGLIGQYTAMTEAIVLELIDFTVTGGNNVSS
jgi:hypothetical protein